MKPLWITPLALLTACGGRASQEVEGIWHFYAASPSTTECTTGLAHNFADVWESEGTDSGDSPWTQTSSSEESQAEFFGALTLSGEDHILLVNGAIYEGGEEDGTWTFTLEQFERQQDARDHESGYRSSTTTEEQAQLRFTGELRRGVFTGRWVSQTEGVDVYTESDTWTVELASEIGTTGAIPSYSYLSSENDFGLVEPLYNAYDTAQCDSDPCSLTVSTACQAELSFVAERTELPLDAWEALNGSSQDYGL